MRPYSLPKEAAQQIVDAYNSAALTLGDLVEETSGSLDADDPLQADVQDYYHSQLKAWMDQAIEQVKEWHTTFTPCEDTRPQALSRGARPLLEEYFKLNAYPTFADKNSLAEHESITFRQVHVWFQNRRSRAKDQGLPLAKPDMSVGWADIDIVEEACYIAAQQTYKRTSSVHAPSPRERSIWRQDYTSSDTSEEEGDEQYSRRPAIAHLTAGRRRKQALPDIDDLVASFDAMNVRDVAYDGIKGRRGYAARQAITYIPPSAPLPSYVDSSRAMLTTAPPSSSLSSAEQNTALLPKRAVARLPKRTCNGPRRCITASESSPEHNSAARTPSLTFSEYSSSSSPSSSPSLSSPLELSASTSVPSAQGQPDATLWASDVAALQSCERLTTAGDCNVPCGEERDLCEHNYRSDSNLHLLPSIPRSISTTWPFRFHPPSQPSTPHTESKSDNYQSSFPTSTFSFAFDTSPRLVPSIEEQRGKAVDAATTLTQLFGPESNAVIMDDTIVFPGLDELALPPVDVDPAAYTGQLDVSVAGWEEYVSLPLCWRNLPFYDATPRIDQGDPAIWTGSESVASRSNADSLAQAEALARRYSPSGDPSIDDLACPRTAYGEDCQRPPTAEFLHIATILESAGQGPITFSSY